jgi:hypothetical protein
MANKPQLALTPKFGDANKVPNRILQATYLQNRQDYQQLVEQMQEKKFNSLYEYFEQAPGDYLELKLEIIEGLDDLKDEGNQELYQLGVEFNYLSERHSGLRKSLKNYEKTHRPHEADNLVYPPVDNGDSFRNYAPLDDGFD